MKISEYYRLLLRWKLNRENKKRLQNDNFTVLSSNCVGGVMLHELGQRFNTPTVNLFLDSSDFIKFLKNLDYYLECELVEIQSGKDYPVGILDDVKIYFTHYSSFGEAKQSWQERSRRINQQNLYVIMVQRTGCTNEIIYEFDTLPFNNKLIFTAKEYLDVKSAYHIPNSTQDDEVMDLCQYKSKFTGRRWIDEYDYVSFFNRG